jgi:hypothetical protein
MTKDEILALEYAAPYRNRPDLWNVLVVPSEDFQAFLAVALGGGVYDWFCADVLALDLERFGRASFHGVVAKAFNAWTVAVWMRPIDLEAAP